MKIAGYLALARLTGATAREVGRPLTNNPYTNKGGGRVYHRAWRAGWLDRDRTLAAEFELNEQLARLEARAEGKGGWL
jgi:hypothetical protein